MQSLARAQLMPPGSSNLCLTSLSPLQASLEQLLQVLHSTTPHYIRCIKPNSKGQAQTFLREEVIHTEPKLLRREPYLTKALEG